ncbi:hypothetical protein LY08_00293 [Olleya aquimaris]|uniref:Uncharacterized protein n=1 Tax=Olleya aquimaris TaxID=639310 RepID=A0A327RNE3_9FLAO|nr:hypothetical protein LY08_00293 [Olleya aquimaris]
MKTVEVKQDLTKIERKPILFKFLGVKFFGKEVTYSPCNKMLKYKIKITDFYVLGISVYHNETNIPC